MMERLKMLEVFIWCTRNSLNEEKSMNQDRCWTHCTKEKTTANVCFKNGELRFTLINGLFSVVLLKCSIAPDRISHAWRNVSAAKWSNTQIIHFHKSAALPTSSAFLLYSSIFSSIFFFATFNLWWSGGKICLWKKYTLEVFSREFSRIVFLCFEFICFRIPKIPSSLKIPWIAKLVIS